jgi:hypothetical protein
MSYECYSQCYILGSFNIGDMVMVGWTLLSPFPSVLAASRWGGTHHPADIGKVVST